MRRRRCSARRSLDLIVDLDEIRCIVAENDAVHVRGLGTRPVASSDSPPPTFVEAPTGILEFQPEEMTVRVGAGTPLATLTECLASSNQFVDLPGRGTVGGALAHGRDGVHSLGRGRLRDTLLGARFVDGRGRLVVAGGSTVKNVSGFDLCRLLVGSRGVLGVMVDVVLRTRPRPLCTRWFVGDVATADQVHHVTTSLHRPSALLWDSQRMWVCLEGHPADVEEEWSRRLPGFALTESEPDVRDRHRVRLDPRDALGRASSECLVEVGRGVVHSVSPIEEPRADGASRTIIRRLKDSFDPDHRLNPHLVGDWSG